MNFEEAKAQIIDEETKAALERAKSRIAAIPSAELTAELKDSYTQEMQAARGDKMAVKKIQARYAARGFDIGSVGFN